MCTSVSSLTDHLFHHLFELRVRDLAVSIDVHLLDHATPHLVVDLLALVQQCLDLRQIYEARVVLY